MPDRDPDSINFPPFETEDLRTNLTRFLDRDFSDPAGGTRKIGNYKWGVYAFFDYDGEPIYVGQTNEMLRTRIRRHLTNQRTDAVAMSVLDPFEVYEIEVWPLPDLQGVSKPRERSGDRWDAWLAAIDKLNALERIVYDRAIEASEFHAVLNEKDPPRAKTSLTPPPSMRACVVSPEVYAIRSHPDFRNARRALIISRLAQVISERKVQGGLRRVLLTQAKRLQWLAERRYNALGGAASVEREGDDEDS
ncbi:GIY-YIG nuclease family protein [Novosphingobium colocasiae]|uniref:GIY-YIG nuclease family protein n=1 Tax=Novosphingobium colocasiae TaxID=1256513 RepID=UPI0035AEAC6F